MRQVLPKVDLRPDAAARRPQRRERLRRPVRPDQLDPNNPDKSVGTVGMVSAATNHTATGLFCRVKERFPGATDLPPMQDPNLKAPAPDDAPEPALVS